MSGAQNCTKPNALCADFAHDSLQSFGEYTKPKILYSDKGGDSFIWKNRLRNLDRKSTCTWLLQCSEMETEEWHISDHKCYTMYTIGILQINDANPPENSHKICKRLYLQYRRDLDVWFRKPFIVLSFNFLRIHHTDFSVDIK